MMGITNERLRHALSLSDPTTRLLLGCGVVAGPVFTVAWIVLGSTRSSYDPLRHPISSLALGDLGWTQVVNLLIAGLLTLAFAFGLRRAFRLLEGLSWPSLVVGAIGVGLLGSGLFVADPLSGYPPGTPNIPEQWSLIGRLHRLFSALVFFGFPIACIRFAKLFRRWGERRWSIYSMLSGVAFIAFFIVAVVGFAQVDGFVRYGGLFQRITITVGFAWLTLLAVYLWRGESQGVETA